MAQPRPFTVVADPGRLTYHAFGLGRASWWKLFGPRVWLEYAKLLFKGRKLQRPTEDIDQLGGDFVVEPSGQVLYAHRSENPADRPGVGELLKVVEGA